jgi:hypothetical protein
LNQESLANKAWLRTALRKITPFVAVVHHHAPWRPADCRRLAIGSILGFAFFQGGKARSLNKSENSALNFGVWNQIINIAARFGLFKVKMGVFGV